MWPGLINRRLVRDTHISMTVDAKAQNCLLAFAKFPELISLLIIAEGDRWLFHVHPLLLQTLQNIIVRETGDWIGHCDLVDHQSQDALMMASAGENVMDLHSVSVISGNIVDA
jgi:hypothetical protein